VTAVAKIAAAARIASGTRLQLLFIDSPSTWDSGHPANGLPEGAADAETPEP
jgi:hypothetical protein